MRKAARDGPPRTGTPELLTATRCFLAALLFSASQVSGAELRLIAPSAPGSGWDKLARALGAAIAAEGTAGLPDIVNVPGSGGTVGLTQFLAARVDGDLLVTGLAMLDATLVQRAPVTLDRLTPIARLSTEPFGLAVPSGSPLHSVDDLRAALLADPSRVAWGGGPAGGIDHVATILLGRALGLETSRLTFVPFLSSAEGAAAAAEEKVGAILSPVGELGPELKGGRIRLLAVASGRRLDAYDVPTLAELGIGLELSNWRGLLGRPDLSRAERDRLAAIVGRIAQTPDWERALERRGWQNAFLAAEEFGAFLRSEQGRIKDALKSAGLLRRTLD